MKLRDYSVQSLCFCCMSLAAATGCGYSASGHLWHRKVGEVLLGVLGIVREVGAE